MSAGLTGRPPKHVLMTADAVGGVWTYALDLAAGLAECGVQVTLAVLGPSPNPGQMVRAGAVPGLGVVETDLPLDWIAEDSGQVRRAGRAVAAFARQLGVDLVHLNSPALAADGVFDAPVVGVCHSCVATWWEAAGTGAMPTDFGWRTELLAAGYGHCDALIAPSAAYASAVARRYGVTPNVVHNGRRWPEALEPRREREQVALTAGRLWDPGKNLATLDRVAARLSAPVLAAGPMTGPEGSRIDLRHVRGLGHLGQHEMADAMARAAIFASLALYEPFGLAVLEAAQAGCALVLSDIPTFRELWDGAAAFVPPTDEMAAAWALEGLLRDPEHCAEWGRRAQVRARTYDVAGMSGRVLAVYAKALRRARAEAAA